MSALQSALSGPPQSSVLRSGGTQKLGDMLGHLSKGIIQGSADWEPAKEPNCELNVLVSTDHHL